jgi:energy-coupling factor transporter transmembrane protein EcfT
LDCKATFNRLLQIYPILVVDLGSQGVFNASAFDFEMVASAICARIRTSALPPPALVEANASIGASH